jgi:predicted nucleotidyltransferase
MDIFDEEILKFWAALQNRQVRYIMVGGYATNLHGFQRYTGDMDIWIEDTSDNRERLRQAFIECGMGDYEILGTMQFVPGWTDFHLMNGLRLDILVSMEGLEGYTFQECLDMASIADIDGVKIPFLHINQLIANKKAVNRPKDQVDVIELERIVKILGDSNLQ